MTRRCSVMRMPVAAQRASIPVAVAAMSVGFQNDRGPWVGSERGDAAFDAHSIRHLRQVVAAHQKGVRIVPRRPAGNNVRGGRRRRIRPIHTAARAGCIVFFDFEKYVRTPWPARWPRCVSEQVARQAAAAMAGIDRDRQYFGFVRGHARDESRSTCARASGDAPAYCVRSASLEFAFAPAAMKRRAHAIAPAARHRAASRVQPPACRRPQPVG